MPRRLIEEAFPLKKVSKDSKHEKNYATDISPRFIVGPPAVHSPPAALWR